MQRRRSCVTPDKESTKGSLACNEHSHHPVPGGGIIVSLFAALGDVLGPKSFAGLFGAAPSVALATIGLTIRQQGEAYAAIEARSMIFGACAFLIYAALVSWLLRRYKPPA